MASATITRALVAVAAVVALSGVGATDPPTVIETKYGPVKGGSFNGVTAFHSIPFGAPPTGQARFKQAQPPAPWTEVKDVTGMPNICPQLKLTKGIVLGHEDCLYLHVYVPDHDPSVKLPVMQWIYGGGYIMGDGYEFGFYDGANMAKEHNVIVVAANYRLDVLGFLALEELQSEDPNGSTGNMALLDQTLALQWTQDNIAAFGGDPSKVAIFGESAGGFSVCWHLVSPSSKGLFSAAIMESGSCDGTQFFQAQKDTFAFGRVYAQAMGCSMTGPALLQCLRDKPFEDLMTSLLSEITNPNWPFNATTGHAAARKGQQVLAQHHAALREAGVPEEHLAMMSAAPPILPPFAPFMSWGPTIDGVALLDLPLFSMQRGEFARVPTIFGTNKNEGMIFVPAFPIVVKNTSFPPSDADMRLIVRHEMIARKMNASVVDSIVDSIMDHYPTAAYGGNLWHRAAGMLTDYFFACGHRRSARAVSATHEDMYLYHFEAKLPWIEYGLLGDYHTTEIPFVFNNQWPPVLHGFNSDCKSLSAAMSKFWTNMAARGGPNDETTAYAWPRYNATGDEALILAWPPAREAGLKKGICDFWDQVEKVLNPPHMTYAPRA